MSLTNFLKLDGSSLEYKILKIALLLGIITSLLLLIFDYTITGNSGAIMLEISGIAVFSILFYLSSDKKNTDFVIIGYIISIFLLLNLNNYMAPGLGLGMLLLFLTALLFTIVLVPDRYRAFFITACSLNLAFLLVLEIIFPEFAAEQLVNVNTPEKAAIAKFIYIAITFTIAASLILYLKSEYDNDKRTIQKLYKKLKEKNLAIEEQNKTIQRINDDLERMVVERTDKLNRQKRKLLEYAFYNSHQVRAPLANIIGTIEIINQFEIDKQPVKQLLNILEKESNRLDSEIHQVQEQLNDSVPINEYMSKS